MLRIIASQYLANLILGFTNAATVQPVIAIERPVFYRERGAGTTHILAPALAPVPDRILTLHVEQHTT